MDRTRTALAALGAVALASAGLAVSPAGAALGEAWRIVNPDPGGGVIFPGPAGGSSCWNHKPSEVQFARLQNDARADKGVVRLRLDAELSKVARLHTRKMARQVKLFHTPTDKFMRRVTNWSLLGENVGVGTNVESLHKAFMDSPAHKANILYPSFRNVGVGVKEDDGRMWVTIVFQAAQNPGTRLRMPSC